MESSNIEWTDDTHNSWEGCTKVSAGCENCYAETRNKRFHDGENWGYGAPRLERIASTRNKPIKWNKEGPDGRRVFCGSLMDWLDREAPLHLQRELVEMILETPRLNWLMLTKRPDRWRPLMEMIVSSMVITPPKNPEVIGKLCGWLNGDAPENVWFGFSAEDQINFDIRWDIVRDIPAAKRFVSVEPQLSMIEFGNRKVEGVLTRARSNPDAPDHNIEISETTVGKLDWAIFGGESGPGARPYNVDWAVKGVAECRKLGVTPFVKQLGAKPEINGTGIRLKDSKGGDWNEWPDLGVHVREWPTGEKKTPPGCSVDSVRPSVARE